MRLTLAISALVLLLASGSTALADDRSLREAGRSRDAQFKELGDRTDRAFRRWARSGYGPVWTRRLLRLNRATRREIRIVVAAVEAEPPSSAYGEDYKRLLLLSLDEFTAALRWEARGVRARAAGRPVVAKRRFERADGLFRRSIRHERQAVEAIRHTVPD